MKLLSTHPGLWEFPMTTRTLQLHISYSAPILSYRNFNSHQRSLSAPSSTPFKCSWRRAGTQASPFHRRPYAGLLMRPQQSQDTSNAPCVTFRAFPPPPLQLCGSSTWGRNVPHLDLGVTVRDHGAYSVSAPRQQAGTS